MLFSCTLFIALSASAQTNLIANPGFETGDATGWSASYGNYAVVANNAHSGTYAAQVGYGSAVQQVVTGLSPSTTYTCTAWLKEANAGQRVYLGAENYNGSASTSQSTTSGSYTQLTLSFTTGTSGTSAQVFVYQSGSNSAYCDDFYLPGIASTGDGTGTQAYRIADCLQRFGVNTFSMLVYNGYDWRWGGSQGNYDPATVGRAINYITGGSGLTINDREYHRDYGGTPSVAMTPLQMTWIKAVYQATNSPFSIAIAAYGGGEDIPGIVSLVTDSGTSGLNYVHWVEGINEPNNYGPISIATTGTVQSALYQQIHAITSTVPVLGPSIVVGLPDPENWLTGYLGTYRASILVNSDANNLHVYPPNSPNASDGSGRGGCLADFNIGYSGTMPGKPEINTEWHPTLDSSIHKVSPAYDAYWGPIYLLSTYVDFNWGPVFWFALFDYDSSASPCGLFATSDADPKPVANAFRALYQLTGDSGAAKSTFAPDKLNVSVSGLPSAPSGSSYAGGRWSLFENSARQYFLMIWNEQSNISGTTTPVTVTFNSHNVFAVSEYNITSGTETAIQSPMDVHSMTVNLDTSLRLLQITYNSPATYSAWQSSLFGAAASNVSVSGELANPAGDGLTNLAKYAFNLDPFQPDAATATSSSVQVSGSTQTITLTHRKNHFATDVTFTYQVSPDLVTWTTTGVSAPVVTALDSQTDLVTVTASSTAPSLFLRVVVTD